MSIGRFYLYLQDNDGRIVDTILRIGLAGQPMKGDQIKIEGVVYVAERVLYQDEEERRTVRRYVVPHIFVRPVARRRASSDRRRQKSVRPRLLTSVPNK